MECSMLLLPDMCLHNCGEKTECTLRMYGDSLHLLRPYEGLWKVKHRKLEAKPVSHSNSSAFRVSSAVQNKSHDVNICFQSLEWPCPAAFAWLKCCQLWIDSLFFNSLAWCFYRCSCFQTLNYTSYMLRVTLSAFQNQTSGLIYLFYLQHTLHPFLFTL